MIKKMTGLMLLAAAAVCSPSIPASVAPASSMAPVLSPRSLVERALKAYGGRDALRGRLAHQVEVGMLEEISPIHNRESYVVYQKGRQRLVTFSMGQLKQKLYWNGSSGWTFSHGRIRPLSPTAIDTQIRDIVHSPQALLDADRPGSRLTALGVRKLPGGALADAVRLTTPGSATELYFDRKTGLLAATGYSAFSAARHSNREYLNLYLDYHQQGGVPVSFRQDGYVDEVLTATATIERTDWTHPIPDTVFIRPVVREERVRSARVPFDFSHGLVMVQASINGGAPRRFLVDTGAAISVIFSSAAEELGLKSMGEANFGGAGGSVGTYLSRLDRVQVGSSVVRDVDVAVIGGFPLSATGASGLLGYTFLSRFQVTIDYALCTLELKPPSTRLPASGTTSMDSSGGVPVLYARVGTRSLPMILDTGAMINVLPGRAASRLHLKSVLHRGMMGADGNPMSMKLARVKHLTVGDQDEADAMVTFLPTGVSTSPILNDRDVGLLGTPFLRHYRLTLDYRRDRLRLQMTPQGRKLPDEWTYPGVDLLAERGLGGARIFSLFAGSPADKAGLRLGQPVVAIDGRSTEGGTTFTLNNTLRGLPNTTVRLTILADGQRKSYLLRRVRIL